MKFYGTGAVPIVLLLLICLYLPFGNSKSIKGHGNEVHSGPFKKLVKRQSTPTENEKIWQDCMSIKMEMLKHTSSSSRLVPGNNTIPTVNREQVPNAGRVTVPIDDITCAICMAVGDLICIYRYCNIGSLTKIRQLQSVSNDIGPSWNTQEGDDDSGESDEDYSDSSSSSEEDGQTTDDYEAKSNVGDVLCAFCLETNNITCLERFCT